MKRLALLAGLLAAGPAALAQEATPGEPAAAREAPRSGPAAGVAARGCAAILERMTEIPGNGPVFLRSYDGDDGTGAPADAPLATAAFTYDNALAAIALVACGQPAQARRIGEALLRAATLDRAGPDGRLRNVYRSGVQAQLPVPPNGWWDKGQGRWLEDATQVGTATGNVAWAGLALLTVHQATSEEKYRDAAAYLAAWTLQHAADTKGRPGFIGGVNGFDDAPEPLTWKSTEHNTDLVALYGWLTRLGLRRWSGPEGTARGFLDAMWDEAGGRFLTGTLPDGITPNRAVSALDAQLWPQLLAGVPAGWRRAMAYAETAHGVAGDRGGAGFDFDGDRDGIWLEGTGQAALVYAAQGRRADRDRLLVEIGREFSPGGYVWAIRGQRLTTGLALAPDSKTADFFYFRRPHLGATAWAVLAATDWNPFTGMRVAP